MNHICIIGVVNFMFNNHMDASSVVVQDPSGLFGNSTFEFGVGTLVLMVYQPALSHTIRKAIDPLEPLELLGNIGGMWGATQNR